MTPSLDNLQYEIPTAELYAYKYSLLQIILTYLFHGAESLLRS
jgi:hypothetical protein